MTAEKQRTFEEWVDYFMMVGVMKTHRPPLRFAARSGDVWASIAKAKIVKRKVIYDVERKTVTIVS